MTIASPAAHAQQIAPLRQFQRATASTLSTLMLASIAALVQTAAPLALPRHNQSWDSAVFPFGEAAFSLEVIL